MIFFFWTEKLVGIMAGDWQLEAAKTMADGGSGGWQWLLVVTEL
jgi:hypothetical protein